MSLAAVEALLCGAMCWRTAACDVATAASGGSRAPLSVAHHSRVFWMLKLSAISPLTHFLSPGFRAAGAASRNEPLSSSFSSFFSFTPSRLSRCLLHSAASDTCALSGLFKVEIRTRVERYRGAC